MWFTHTVNHIGGNKTLSKPKCFFIKKEASKHLSWLNSVVLYKYKQNWSCVQSPKVKITVYRFWQSHEVRGLTVLVIIESFIRYILSSRIFWYINWLLIKYLYCVNIFLQTQKSKQENRCLFIIFSFTPPRNDQQKFSCFCPKSLRRELNDICTLMLAAKCLKMSLRCHVETAKAQSKQMNQQWKRNWAQTFWSSDINLVWPIRSLAEHVCCINVCQVTQRLKLQFSAALPGDHLSIRVSGRTLWHHRLIEYVLCHNQLN